MRTKRKRVGEAIKQQGGSLDNQLELIHNAADASMIEIGTKNVDRNPGPNYDDMAEVTKSTKQSGKACDMLADQTASVTNLSRITLKIGTLQDAINSPRIQQNYS